MPAHHLWSMRVMVAALLLLGDHEELTTVSILGYEGKNLEVQEGGFLA